MGTIKYFLTSSGFILMLFLFISCLISGLIGKHRKQFFLPSFALGVLGPIGWLIVWHHKRTLSEIEESNWRAQRSKWALQDFTLLGMLIASAAVSFFVWHVLNVNLEKIPHWVLKVFTTAGYIYYYCARATGRGTTMNENDILQVSLYWTPFLILSLICFFIFFKLLHGRLEKNRH